ncbi:uracil nucleotide/cysteinyl leukotriene receptor-like [Ctenopharyngodon idella]|uniref:uracil nucleotide/cysteinyl leukotriene receptor-like n=1 Tax=Ctenopharyngodon idella TaxID=7959 RepID=UPI00223285AB|nr:uracil nucleotide/cysteinyl leukotriene receptor-like [Ctenopharyngodon idella]
MINSVNFTAPEAFTNSTTQTIGLPESLEICVYFIYFLFGLPLHSYVLWLIITGTGSGVASEFFNLNLSVCEIANSLNCFFFVLSIWFSSHLTLKLFLIGLSVTGRPLFQCLICVERYLAVVHPVTFLKFKPLRYRVICCTVAWIMTLGSCLCCMLILVSVNIIAHTRFVLLQFIFFLSIQLFCCFAVLRALKQSGPGERGREKGEENHMKRRAFYLILITTVNMVILYVPITISALFNNLAKLNFQKVWSPSVICYVLAGFVQPVLYLHRNGKLLCFCSP